MDRHENSYIYENTYLPNGKLQSTKMYSQFKDYYWTKTYTYHKDLLFKESLCNKENKVYETYYKYNEQNDLAEKEVRLSTGEVSYYVVYQKTRENGYFHKIISPARSQYKWQLSDLEGGLATIDLLDDITTVEVIDEIYQYIIQHYADIKYIEFFMLETDMETYWEEIIKREAFYKRDYGIEAGHA